MNPGTTVICCASTTGVRAVARLRTSLVDPTAVKRPFFTANASARGIACSLVSARTTAPLVDMVTRMAKIGRASSPTLSPDGARVAFVSDRTGVPQVWVTTIDGGTALQVTTGDDPIGRVIWSPNGEWLAFSLAPG